MRRILILVIPVVIIAALIVCVVPENQRQKVLFTQEILEKKVFDYACLAVAGDSIANVKIETDDNWQLKYVSVIIFLKLHGNELARAEVAADSIRALLAQKYSWDQESWKRFSELADLGFALCYFQDKFHQGPSELIRGVSPEKIKEATLFWRDIMAFAGTAKYRPYDYKYKK